MAFGNLSPCSEHLFLSCIRPLNDAVIIVILCIFYTAWQLHTPTDFIIKPLTASKLLPLCFNATLGFRCCGYEDVYIKYEQRPEFVGRCKSKFEVSFLQPSGSFEIGLQILHKICYVGMMRKVNKSLSDMIGWIALHIASKEGKACICRNNG